MSSLGSFQGGDQCHGYLKDISCLVSRVWGKETGSSAIFVLFRLPKCEPTPNRPTLHKFQIGVTGFPEKNPTCVEEGTAVDVQALPFSLVLPEEGCVRIGCTPFDTKCGSYFYWRHFSPFRCALRYFRAFYKSLLHSFLPSCFAVYSHHSSPSGTAIVVSLLFDASHEFMPPSFATRISPL